ncbi:hypothetical protein E2C11_07390 [Streptomyces lavendulae]|nr:hypothetical protein [Streptomyces lavendulae]TXJ83291.1 hypothetical protein E2C11_07390 [Streptomyces lavendulae]
MLWPALRALSHGELSSDQIQWLIDTFGMDQEPRTEGPGAAQSIAHRSLTDEVGARLVLDLARTGESGWVFTLFHQGQQPSTGTVEAHRALFREVIARLGLTLVEISPAATADEVLVASTGPEPESALGAHWALPDQLAMVWPHVGLRNDAPQEVKEVKLRELMSTPAWAAAPTSLREQAEAFLRSA